MFEPLIAYTPYLALLLRVVGGFSLTLHGYPKLKNPQASIGWMKSVGVPAVAVWLAIILEFFGGLALIIGFLVPIVAFFMVVQFAAICLVKKAKLSGRYIRMDQGVSYEIDVMYLIMGLALFTLGAGALSIDALLGI